MNYVTLGKTGLKAAVVSFGGIPIQRADGANTKAVVDKLEEYGINYIDTARGYTVSEEYLGAALEGRRDKFILATKSMSRDAASMAADVETSLRNLRTGYIDLYQLHNLPEKDIEKVFGPGGAYEALTAAREAGKIGHIGVTAHSADALKILVEDYADRIETVMFPYNIVEDQGRDVLALAREKGIGTIAMKPLAGGNLDDWELALRYIAASGVIDIMIPGMGSPEEVDRNASVDLAAPLTAEELARCDAVRKELGTQFCRRCGYCAPCPNGIDIPSNFLMANYARKYGLAGWPSSVTRLCPTTPAPVSCAAPARSAAPTACPSATCWRAWPRCSGTEHGPVGYGLGHIAGHVRPFSAGACGLRPYRPGRLAQTAQVGARIRRGAGLRPSAVGPVGVCISSRVRPLTRRMPFYGQNRKILLSAPGHQRLLCALPVRRPVLHSGAA